MSRMTIYKILRNGDLETFAEFGNGCRGALLLWDHFSKKYFPGRQFSMLSWKEEEKEEFWDLVYNSNLSDDERITLWHTYDRVMVKKKNIPRLIQSFLNVGRKMEDPGHLLEQAEKLKEIVDIKDVIGICWQQTSVTDAWNDAISYDYKEYTDEEGFSGELSKERPFNIFKDKHGGNHYWLFDHFNECKKKEETINQELKKIEREG